jgi:DNA-binding transcriptional regulator YdaS (Cro superfamily)
MELKIWLSSERGRSLRLANELGVSPPMVSDWCTGKKAVPLDRCMPIERATGGVVTRKDLRPNDWQHIWPELASLSTHTPPAPTPAITATQG